MSSNSTNKVPFDPGWNDPPPIAFSAQITPNKQRKILNKRVAFPLSGGCSNPVSSSHVIPPMPTTVTLPPTVSAIPRKLQSEDEINIDCQEILLEVKNILLAILDNNSELGVKANDIQRRLEIMEDMWNNQKLNKSVQIQMKELANALQENEPKKADNIHRALMVDHVSEVGTWMPGVKQLIHNCIARAELLAIDKELN